jgi:acyl-CoA synthetase (AMP-forming)/AMP-acid ligase II/acyl carrier protein
MSHLPFQTTPISVIAEPSTLAGYLRSCITANANKRCIEIDHAGRRASKTFAELDAQSTSLQPLLRRDVRAAQSHVILCFESVLDFVPAVWAGVLGGYSCLPWHVQRRCSDQELATRLGYLARKLDNPVLLTSRKLKDRIIQIDAWPQAILSLDQTSSESEMSAEVSHSNLEAIDAANGLSESGAFLLCTSGSTGDPKISIVTYPCALARARRLRAASTNGRALRCFPFDSVSGMSIFIPKTEPAIYIQPEYFAAQPAGILKAVEEFQLNSFSLTTTMAARLQEAASTARVRYDLTSLQCVGYGGEPILADVVSKLSQTLERLGAKGVKASFGYGATETGLICWSGRKAAQEAVKTLPLETKPVSVGSVKPDYSLRIVDDEGNCLPERMTGNIEVYSKSLLFSGYLDDDAANTESFAADGWFKTGDLGVMVNGELAITGRKKSTIIVGGRNIAPEPIEAASQALEGIEGGLVAAVPVRTGKSVTDELALFFVPRAGADIDEACRQIGRDTAWRWGITVQHFIPLTAEEFPLTRTGKIQRTELAAQFQSGSLSPRRVRGLRRDGEESAIAKFRHRLGKLVRKAQRLGGASAPHSNKGRNKRLNKDAANAEVHSRGDHTDSLGELWRQTLKLDKVPPRDANFFDLGGDSLASAELIFAVEERFSCELPAQSFFEDPTITHMEALLPTNTTARPQPGREVTPHRAVGLLHKLRVLSATWNGERLFRDSLLIGFNTDGGLPPIFWVLQGQEEAKALAKHLGSEQPLYVMRSCAGTASRYTASVLETVGNRYLWEILAARPSGPIVLGGNCQGGILALVLARRLQQIGRAPVLLTLLDWTFSYGRYDGPTLLIYGKSSYSAEVYEQPGRSTVDWRNDFPASAVVPVPGKHGQFFSEEHAPELCALIREYASSV